MGGHRELVKSVLSSMPIYLRTALRPQKKFNKDFDKITRRFLWAGDQQLHGGKCKVNWSKVCRPLNRGSLGILNLECFGRTLHLRWLWFQWTTPDKPWCLADLLMDNVDEALFSAAARVAVHNGRKAKFWLSSWINGGAPALMLPNLYNPFQEEAAYSCRSFG
jgi:hypothetical protein